MKWKELKKSYSTLLNKVQENKDFSKEWNNFKVNNYLLKLYNE